MTKSKVTLPLAAIVLLSGCATPPMGPSVQAIPGPNKPWDVFQHEQTDCQVYAGQMVQGQAEQANDRALGTAAVGTLLGAGLGAAIGGGRGAAIGAGAGALGGTAIGTNQNGWAQGSIQQHYDGYYTACMIGHGNQMPGYVMMPPGYAPPPPPPGYAPPPPPPPGY